MGAVRKRGNRKLICSGCGRSLARMECHAPQDGLEQMGVDEIYSQADEVHHRGQQLETGEPAMVRARPQARKRSMSFFSNATERNSSGSTLSRGA